MRTMILEFIAHFLKEPLHKSPPNMHEARIRKLTRHTDNPV